MEKKFEKLSLAEIGIISFMALVLIISLGASWYKDSQTKTTATSQQQVATVDSNYKAAEDAVIALEGNQTKEKLEAAQAAVDKVTDASKKQELQTRINKVKISADNLTDAQTKAKLKAELIRAEAAKKLEEERKKASSSSSSSSSSSVATESVVTETSAETEDTSYVEESYQADRYDYVVPSQNSYIAPSTAYTSQTSQTSQSVTPTPSPSSSTVVESSEASVTEAPVTEPPTTDTSTSTEVSTESTSSSADTSGSSVENP
ncbi:TPA: serine protease [Streptococcus suis]